MAIEGQNKFSKVVKWLGLHMFTPCLVSVLIIAIYHQYCPQRIQEPSDPISISNIYITYTTLLFTIISVVLVVSSIYFTCLFYERKEDALRKTLQEVKSSLLNDPDLHETVIGAITNNKSLITDLMEEFAQTPEFQKIVRRIMVSNIKTEEDEENSANLPTHKIKST